MKSLVLIVPLSLLVSFYLTGGIPLVGGTTATRQLPNRRGERNSPPSREVRALGKLKSLLEPVGVTVSQAKIIKARGVNFHRRLLIRWVAHPDSPVELVPEKNAGNHGPSSSMTVLENKQRAGSVPQPFELKLVEGRILVIGVDDNNQLKWWDVINDPRILRGEFPGADGQLSGTTYYRSTAHLFVTVPDSPEVIRLQFLLPKSSGSEIVLEPVSSISLR